MGWEGFQAGICKWWEAGKGFVRAAAGEARGQEGALGLRVVIGQPQTSGLGEECLLHVRLSCLQGCQRLTRESTRDLPCEGNISACHGGKNQKLLLFIQLLIKVFFPNGSCPLLLHFFL